MALILHSKSVHLRNNSVLCTSLDGYRQVYIQKKSNINLSPKVTCFNNIKLYLLFNIYFKTKHLCMSQMLVINPSEYFTTKNCLFYAVKFTGNTDKQNVCLKWF